MTREEIPIVGGIARSGAEDRVLDSPLLVGPLLVGPVLVAFVTALGRTPLATGLAAGYLVAFVGPAVYSATTRSR